VTVWRFEAAEFCDACGSPMPWASRQARLWELENVLQEDPDLSEADRLTIAEQLDALREPDLSEDDQVERWRRIKKVAPSLLGAGLNIFVSVTSAYVQTKLGV
jgi:hypothetical protein